MFPETWVLFINPFRHPFYEGKMENESELWVISIGSHFRREERQKDGGK